MQLNRTLADMPAASPGVEVRDDAGPAGRYSFKASLGGGESEFSLQPDALEFRRGGAVVRVPYDGIRQVRLAFRPTTIQPYRFVTEIRPAAGGKLTLVSASARSMIEQQRLDAPYRAFVVELHRRLATAGHAVRFRAGSPAWLYWPGVAAIGALSISAAILAYRALPAADWTNTLLFLGMLALFLWQMGAFLYRNRPGGYTPDRLPRRVMP